MSNGEEKLTRSNCESGDEPLLRGKYKSYSEIRVISYLSAS